MKQWMQPRGGLGWAIVLSASMVLPAAAQFGGAGGGGGLGGGFGSSGFGGGRRGSLARQSAQELLRQRQVELDLIKDKTQTLRARYEAGTATMTELRNAELELVQAQGALAAAQAEATREKRLQDLNRYVDVDLQGATVRQAAQALSKASGMSIKVDDRVPNEARLTVRGRSVPMAVLLDRLGNRANLMISPSEDGQGVELDVWPALELDGERTIYKGPLAPWSTEWGTVPITGVYQSESLPLPGEIGASQPPGPVGSSPSATVPGRSSPLRPTGGAGSEGLSGGYPGMMGGPGLGMPGMASAAASSASAVASIGVGNGSIVVAEPGVKDGQAGLWLTVYKLSGNSLLKIGTGFHKSGATSSPTRKPAGRPGMGGALDGAPGASPYGDAPAVPFPGNPYGAANVDGGFPEPDAGPLPARPSRVAKPSAPKPAAGGIPKDGARRPSTAPTGKTTPKR